MIKKSAIKPSYDARVYVSKIEGTPPVFIDRNDDKLNIYVCTPQWIDGNHEEEALLSKCYIEALKIADENNCENIVIPLGLEADTFPKDRVYEGRYTPTNAYGKRESCNVYGKTYEECEAKLEEMIARKRAEIAAEKELLKAMQTA